MSKWCPACQRMSQTGDKCDFCGNPMEDTFNKDILLNQILQEISDEDITMQNIHQVKKNRDLLYEEFIAEHYRELGYTVTEHRKEITIDEGIDLIAKKDDEVILIKCKDLNANHLDSIDNKDIKVLRIDVYDFLDKNPLFKTYQIKIKYILSGNFIENSAKKYLTTCNDDISYDIILPTYKKEKQPLPEYSEKVSSKKIVKQNRKLEKIIVLIIIVLIILFFWNSNTETKPLQSADTNKTSHIVPKKQKEVKVQEKREKQEQERIKRLLAEQKAEREQKEKVQKARREKEQEALMQPEDQIQITFKKKTLEDQKTQKQKKDTPKVLNAEDARLKAKRNLLEQMQVKQKTTSQVAEIDDPRAEAKRKLLEQMQFSN